MYEDVPSSNIPNKTILIELVNENVIHFHLENTLRTRVKQIRNPRNESFGGFLL